MSQSILKYDTHYELTPGFQWGRYQGEKHRGPDVYSCTDTPGTVMLRSLLFDNFPDVPVSFFYTDSGVVPKSDPSHHYTGTRLLNWIQNQSRSFISTI